MARSTWHHVTRGRRNRRGPISPRQNNKDRNPLHELGLRRWCMRVSHLLMKRWVWWGGREEREDVPRYVNVIHVVRRGGTYHTSSLSHPSHTATTFLPPNAKSWPKIHVQLKLDFITIPSYAHLASWTRLLFVLCRPCLSHLRLYLWLFYSSLFFCVFRFSGTLSAWALFISLSTV